VTSAKFHFQGCLWQSPYLGELPAIRNSAESQPCRAEKTIIIFVLELLMICVCTLWRASLGDCVSGIVGITSHQQHRPECAALLTPLSNAPSPVHSNFHCGIPV